MRQTSRFWVQQFHVPNMILQEEIKLCINKDRKQHAFLHISNGKAHTKHVLIIFFRHSVDYYVTMQLLAVIGGLEDCLVFFFAPCACGYKKLVIGTSLLRTKSSNSTGYIHTLGRRQHQIWQQHQMLHSAKSTTSGMEEAVITCISKSNT